MSSCSRLAVLALLLWPALARAVNVHAVYRTACERELGIILKVERRAIQLLRLDGTTVEIPRHEIASLAYYAVTRLPRAGLDAGVERLRVETLYRGEVVELADGWPVDYSETKLSLLLPSGKDLVIDKNSIWSLTFGRPAAGRAAPPDPAAAVSFVHPQTAGFCAQEDDAPGARRVFAQQILNDKVVIKRELDRLAEGHRALVTAAEDQKFYPVPQVYENRTSLGIWASVASRYGASKSRPNNLTPMVSDERSFGPFRYQHVFLSGVAPSEMLLHAEAQSQVYYRFKVAYFHAAVFFDPNLILVGSSYPWRREDLDGEALDDRINEYAGLEFGFDLGPVALELGPAMGAQAAVKTERFFDQRRDLNLWRAGLRYTRRSWEAKVTAGAWRRSAYSDVAPETDAGPSYGEADWRHVYGRLNLELRPWERFGLFLSAIARTLDYRLEWQHRDGASTETYRSTSVSTAAQGWYALGRRFQVGGNLVLEHQRRRGTGDAGDRTRWLPRAGVFTSFSF